MIECANAKRQRDVNGHTLIWCEPLGKLVSQRLVCGPCGGDTASPAYRRVEAVIAAVAARKLGRSDPPPAITKETEERRQICAECDQKIQETNGIRCGLCRCLDPWRFRPWCPAFKWGREEMEKRQREYEGGEHV